MCSVHPKIQENALDLDNSDPEDCLACERLLKKLLVPVDIVNSDDQERAKAVVIDTFLMDLRQFQNKEGHFQSCHIWIIAEDENTLAHEWHQKYSLPFTKVFGKFACIVTLKTTGVGGAKHHWEVIKRNKKGKRGKLGTEKVMELSRVLAAYSYEKARTRRLKAQQAGKLWEDDDFENYNKFCSNSLLEKPLTATRIFRAWEEGWEKVQFDSSGDDKFAA